MEFQRLKLQSSDGILFDMDAHLFDCSKHIQSEVRKLVPVENLIGFRLQFSEIDSDILKKVISWSYHANVYHLRKNLENVEAADLSQWETEFFKLDFKTLQSLLEAAEYLEIDDLSTKVSKGIENRRRVFEEHKKKVLANKTIHYAEILNIKRIREDTDFIFIFCFVLLGIALTCLLYRIFYADF